MYMYMYISGALQAQSSSAYSSSQLMRGEFPETLCMEQGVVLSCRFADSGRGGRFNALLACSGWQS